MFIKAFRRASDVYDFTLAIPHALRREKRRRTRRFVRLENGVGRAGFEPATFRLSVERSSRAELPARDAANKLNGMLVNKNFRKSFNGSP